MVFVLSKLSKVFVSSNDTTLTATEKKLLIAIILAVVEEFTPNVRGYFVLDGQGIGDEAECLISMDFQCRKCSARVISKKLINDALEDVLSWQAKLSDNLMILPTKNGRFLASFATETESGDDGVVLQAVTKTLGIIRQNDFVAEKSLGKIISSSPFFSFDPIDPLARYYNELDEIGIWSIRVQEKPYIF